MKPNMENQVRQEATEIANPLCDESVAQVVGGTTVLPPSNTSACSICSDGQRRLQGKHDTCPYCGSKRIAFI